MLDDFAEVYMSAKCAENFRLERQGLPNLREENALHRPYVAISKIVSGYRTVAQARCRVIGGEAAAVARAGELARAAGARRLVPLRVSGAFHTPLMQPAAEALHERFKTQRFGAMRFPVIFNCLGDVRGEQSVAQLLEQQVVSPVRMEDTIRRLAALGVDTAVEIGPGRALSGFVGRTAGSAIRCIPAEDVPTVAAALAELPA